MSKFDYPKLSLTEIVTILTETEISVITENDMKNPSQDFVSDLYTRLLIYLDILHEYVRFLLFTSILVLLSFC